MRGQLRQRKKERFLLAPYAVRGKRFIAAADNPKKKKPTPLDSKIALASSDTDLKNRKPQQPAEKQNIKRTSPRSHTQCEKGRWTWNDYHGKIMGNGAKKAGTLNQAQLVKQLVICRKCGVKLHHNRHVAVHEQDLAVTLIGAAVRHLALSLAALDFAAPRQQAIEIAD